MAASRSVCVMWLQDIMVNIHKACKDAAEEYKTNLQAGANIAGFLKVSCIGTLLHVHMGIAASIEQLFQLACQCWLLSAMLFMRLPKSASSST